MNGAELYRDAFARLPDGDYFAYVRQLGQCGPDAENLVGLGKDALGVLQQAVSCDSCDWGREAALGVPLKDFDGARRLAILALLARKSGFDSGKPIPDWRT